MIDLKYNHERARWEDDGGMIEERPIISFAEQRALFSDITRDAKRWHAQHRTALHLSIIGTIAALYCLDGHFIAADWLFVALSVMIEVNA
jgi:hypothetical protein